MVDVNRVFAELDVLSDGITIRQDTFLNQLQQHPPPWTLMQRVKIKVDIKELQRDLDKWDENIGILSQKAARTRGESDRAALYFRIDSWNRTHEDLINTLRRTIDTGNECLQLDIQNVTVAATPEPSTSTVLKIPALNIQKFDGDYLKWKAFWQRFEINVDNHPFSNVEKMDALVGLLEGEALDEIAGFEISDENYDTVVKTLLDRFGNTKLILKELYSNLHKVPPATSDAKSIRTTVNTITNMCRQLKNYGVNIDNDALQAEIIEKMPPREKNKLTWFQIKNTETTTETILEQMKEFALKAEISAQDTAQHSRSDEQLIYDTEMLPTNSDTENCSSKMFACSLCEEPHPTGKCPQFISIGDKIKQLKLKRCCTNCARRNHEASQCRATLKCLNCDGNHYVFLCPTKDTTNVRKPATSNTFISLGKQQGCLLTKQVAVINPLTKESVDATVLFDPGSQRSFVSENLIRQLKLPWGDKEEINLQGIGAKATNYTSKLVKLQIKTTEGHEDICTNSIKKIASSVTVVNFEKDDISTYTVADATPDVLIGIDYFFDFITSFERKNDMVIIQSKVGQMLSGNIRGAQSNTTISSLAIEQKKLYDVGTKKPGNTLLIPNVGTGRTFYAKRKQAKATSPKPQQLQKPVLSTTLTQSLYTKTKAKTEQCHGQRSSISHLDLAKRELHTAIPNKVESQLVSPHRTTSSFKTAGGEGPPERKLSAPHTFGRTSKTKALTSETLIGKQYFEGNSLNETLCMTHRISIQHRRSINLEPNG